MATVINDLLESAFVRSLTETVYVIADEFETAALNDAAYTAEVYYVLETAVLNDYAYPSATTQEDVLDTAALNDAAYPVALVTHDILETAELNDFVTLSNPTADVLETAVLNDYATTSVVGRIDITDTAELNDYVSFGLEETVYETAALNDSTDAIITGYVLETAVLNDYTTEGSTRVLDVLETAELNDYVSLAAVVSETITETAYISSAVYPSEVEERNDIFTANTVNWAMSVYTGLELTGKAGRYAVAASGLYQVTADYADAVLETGFSALGSDKRKAVRSAYVYAEHEYPLTIEVTADVSGQEQSHEYTQMARNADDTRAVRCSFGRGFRSNYYKMRLSSSGYARAITVLPVVNALGRRI